MSRLSLIERILFADVLSNELRAKFNQKHAARLKKGIDWRVADGGDFYKNPEWADELLRNSSAITPEEKARDEYTLMLMRDLGGILRQRDEDSLR